MLIWLTWVTAASTIFALTAIKMFDLTMVEPPFRLIEPNEQPIALFMIWHERCDTDPLNAWVRDVLIRQLSGWHYT